jgi:hypothetical protein
LGASLLGFVTTLLCASFMVLEVFILKNIEKDWLGFLLLLRRVSHDTSCVLVHGICSCDLGDEGALTSKGMYQFLDRPKGLDIRPRRGHCNLNVQNVLIS